MNGEGASSGPGGWLLHCLLIESEGGLVLVDTGIGFLVSRARGEPWVCSSWPWCVPVSTSERPRRGRWSAGFEIADVRHIVMTHLDLDHAGGLPDFPKARVHVLDLEHQAAMKRSTRAERSRYRPAQWAHGGDWAVHRAGGERWMGFECVQPLGRDVEPEVLLVPWPDIPSATAGLRCGLMRAGSCTVAMPISSTGRWRHTRIAVPA